MRTEYSCLTLSAGGVATLVLQLRYLKGQQPKGLGRSSGDTAALSQQGSDPWGRAGGLLDGISLFRIHDPATSQTGHGTPKGQPPQRLVPNKLNQDVGPQIQAQPLGGAGRREAFPNVTPCPNLLRGALSNTTSPDVNPKASLMFRRRKVK